jgi:hypothetical protein
MGGGGGETGAVRMIWVADTAPVLHLARSSLWVWL